MSGTDLMLVHDRQARSVKRFQRVEAAVPVSDMSNYVAFDEVYAS